MRVAVYWAGGGTGAGRYVQTSSMTTHSLGSPGESQLRTRRSGGPGHDMRFRPDRLMSAAEPARPGPKAGCGRRLGPIVYNYDLVTTFTTFRRCDRRVRSWTSSGATRSWCCSRWRVWSLAALSL